MCSSIFPRDDVPMLFVFRRLARWSINYVLIIFCEFGGYPRKLKLLFRREITIIALLWWALWGHKATTSPIKRRLLCTLHRCHCSTPRGGPWLRAWHPKPPCMTFRKCRAAGVHAHVHDNAWARSVVLELEEGLGNCQHK